MQKADGYEDIIHLPHHVSERRPHMPLAERAAQFLPFAALSGYDDVIRRQDTQEKRSNWMKVRKPFWIRNLEFFPSRLQSIRRSASHIFCRMRRKREAAM